MKRLLGVLVLVGVVLFGVGYVSTHWSRGLHCTVLGAGVAYAADDCLHQNAFSDTWAKAQLQAMTVARYPVTTGLLFTTRTAPPPSPSAAASRDRATPPRCAT